MKQSNTQNDPYYTMSQVARIAHRIVNLTDKQFKRLIALLEYAEELTALGVDNQSIFMALINLPQIAASDNPIYQ